MSIIDAGLQKVTTAPNPGDPVHPTNHILNMAADTDSIVPLSEVRSFVNRCMVSVGTNPEHADILAELLMTADHRGHYSHGINRLGNLFVSRL